MTFLEYCEQTSTVPLMWWQHEFITNYEKAIKEGKQLFFYFPPRNGRTMLKNLIDNYYHPKEATH